MVVADTILEARRRTCRLNAPDELLADKNVKRIVDRLQRDRADLRPHSFGDGVGRDVRVTCYCPQDR